MVELSLFALAALCIWLTLRIRKLMSQQLQRHDHAWYEHVGFRKQFKRYKEVYGTDRKVVMLRIMTVVTAAACAVYLVVFVRNFRI